MHLAIVTMPLKDLSASELSKKKISHLTSSKVTKEELAEALLEQAKKAAAVAGDGSPSGGSAALSNGSDGSGRSLDDLFVLMTKISDGQDKLSAEVNDLKGIRAEVDEVRSDVTMLKTYKEAVETRQVVVESRVDALARSVMINKDMNEQHDNYIRRDQCKIAGVPLANVVDGDGKIVTHEDTHQLVIDFMAKIGVKAEKADFSRCHRLAPSKNTSRGATNRQGQAATVADVPAKPPMIVVSFVRGDLRTELFRNKKKLEDTEGCKDIYVHDNLTSARAKLLRQLKAAHDVKKAYSIGGKLKVVLDKGNGREETHLLDHLFLDIEKKLKWSKDRIDQLKLFDISDY